MAKSGPKALVADRERADMAVIESALKPWGYEIVRAESGEQILEKIRKDEIDIVLLDGTEADFDGFETCRSIKEDEKYRHVPVVMITGEDPEEDHVRCIQSGADDRIAKPLEPEVVFASAQKLLKAREAHEKLTGTYDTLRRLNAHGQSVFRSFNPLTFDFLSGVDSIVDQIIWRLNEPTHRPQTMLIGYLDRENEWQFYHYQYVFNKLNRLLIKSDIHRSLYLPKKGISKTGFINSEDIERSELYRLVTKLTSHTIIIKNIVYYLSDVLFICAANYDGRVDRHDESVLGSVAAYGLFLKLISARIHETEKAFEYVLLSLSRALEAHNEETRRHQLRVGKYCSVLAGKMGMTGDFVRTIGNSAALHDVGKIYIPPEFSTKTGKLSPDDWKVIRDHTTHGAKIIGDHFYLKMARSIALNHHERWDGTGYPRKLKGDSIPFEARITAIADQYDALRSRRSYRSAYDHKTACSVLTEGDGRTIPSHFDHRVLKTFKDLMSRFDEIHNEMNQRYL